MRIVHITEILKATVKIVSGNMVTFWDSTSKLKDMRINIQGYFARIFCELFICCQRRIFVDQFTHTTSDVVFMKPVEFTSRNLF